MARKKHKPDKGKAGGRKRGSPRKSKEDVKQNPAPAGLPPGSPRALARELITQAYEETSPAVQVDLATKALALDPDAIEPHLLLAENASRRKDAMRHYEQAVAASQRVLGSEALPGRLGSLPEMRPALHAHLGLAHTLWVLGRRDQAVLQAREVLRLDPDDSQDVRYTLAGWLLALDRDTEAAQLLEQYPRDESTAWAYTRVLLSFRHHGASDETRKLLKQARKANKYVPRVLLGTGGLPPQPPAAYSEGDPGEAVHYAATFLSAWRATDGALDFLREAIAASRKKKNPPPQPAGPTVAVQKQLRKLEQKNDVWQVECRRLPQWAEEAGVPIRPWLILVLNLQTQQAIGNNMSAQQPSAALIWDTLAQAMQSPMMDQAHRPTEIQYRTSWPWQELQTPLQEIDVRWTPVANLPEIEEVLPRLAEHLAGKPEPGLLDVPGVTPELVGRFYEAAASYFRQAPWRLVGYESAIEVRCDKFHSGPWYAVVMGQSGLTLGLALYEDLDVLRRMWTEEASEEDNARQTVGTSVTFGEPPGIPVADLEASERHGWMVARPDAYPSVFHKERGLSMRPPLAWELELLEGCLRAIPDFVKRRPQDDTTPEQVTVPAGTGTLNLTLAWVDEESNPPQPPEPRGREKQTTPRDDLIEMALEHEAVIRHAYKDFKDKEPIILYDIQEGRIYAYPYAAFKKDLSEKSQKALEEQYQRALRDNQIVVFVRDNEERRLVSFSLDQE